MQIKNRWVLGATATLAGAAIALGGALPASADPSVNDRVLNGTGSDTTQDVNNGLAATVLGNHDGLAGTANRTILGSFDALPQPSTINTPTSVTFNRPNGSGAGVKALKSAKDATTTLDGPLGVGTVNLNTADLQFARSSSFAPSATWSTTGAYQYIPLAVDAVTYAKHASSGAIIPTNLPLGASVNEIWPTGTGLPNAGRLKLTLKNIYGTNPTFDDSFDGDATKFQLFSAATGGINRTVGAESSTAQIVPFIPQANSGTKQFWHGTITGSTGVALGSHVSATYGAGLSVQEHDGSVLAALPTRAIVPFSIAQHIAQEKVGINPAHYSGTYAGVSVTDRRNGAVLQQIDGVNPLSAPATLNPTFPVRRAVFTVVQRAEYLSAGTVGTLLRATFGAGGTAYSAVRPGTGTTVLSDFGFGSLAGGVNFIIEGTAFNTVTPGEVSNRFRANP